MQRIAPLLILAAVPLLCASMLAQNNETSGDGMMRASVTSATNQCFHGQWFSASDIAQESSCTMSGFVGSAQPIRAAAKQRTIMAQSKSIHALISLARLEPVYENLADPQLVRYSRSDVAKLYFLRPTGQMQNHLDPQKIELPSEFAREWKQGSKAAEIHSVAQVESAANFRAALAVRTRNGMRRPTYSQRDGDSENNCLISEEDATPAQQYRGIVTTALVGAGMKDPLASEKLRASEVEAIRSIESSQIWTEVTSVAIKGNTSKAKNGLVVK